MSPLININEIVQYAVKIEESGYRFYTEAIKKVNLNKVTQFFQIMADEEKKHEYIFKNMLKDKDKYVPYESYPGEYESYMWDFLKDHSLGNQEKLKEKIDSLKSARDAIQMALEFEKDSIVLFSMIKKMVDDDDKEKVEGIIQEEILHIMRIKEFAREIKIQL